VLRAGLRRAWNPFYCSRSFRRQEALWGIKDRQEYARLLKASKDIIVVTAGGYAREKMQIRNEFIVDHSHLLFAVWSGKKFGGTYNCIQFAKLIGRDIHYINPLNLVH
jgi:uncharacterized phage-like protein YoqJ